MIKEVAKDIFQISVVLPNNPLKELNSYFIRGKDRDILLDTGFRREESRLALQQGLDELGSIPERRDVLITHLHADHIGMADLFVGEGRHIYFYHVELENERIFLEGGKDSLTQNGYVEAGFSLEMLKEIDKNNPAVVMSPPCLTEHYRPLFEGDILDVGDYHLQVVPGPGHTPGNAMFWDEGHGIMFTGDHVLFNITPNITAWPGYNFENSLKQYLASLAYADTFPVKLALPGHRMTGDYHGRIHELMEHHKHRLNETLSIVKANPGLSPYDIAAQMTWQIRARNWEEFPSVQKWFAVGECMSHLDYLSEEGLVTAKMIDGVWHYNTI